MGIDRRDFLKGLGAGIAGAASGAVLTPSKLNAKQIGETETEEIFNKKEFMGVLVDTKRCVGCRSCEEACAEAHNLPVPDIEDESVFETERQTTDSQWTVVNRYETEKGEIFVKRQCMHCNQPACAAACLVDAMYKTEQGPVIWNENCMGCRYCMVSCPFDIPKFEYGKFNPKVQKCSLCWERLKEGEEPACVEACPEEALVFGSRRELIEEANKRIYQNPGKYVSHIYGEHEVGGTGYLYLSQVPFEQIGFRTDLGTTPYPEYTAGFLYSVPFVLLIWPALLSGISYATRWRDEIKGKEGGTR